jgi:hypothetical protein
LQWILAQGLASKELEKVSGSLLIALAVALIAGLAHADPLA